LVCLNGYLNQLKEPLNFSVQVFLRGVVRELLIPYLNFSSRRGFPLPVPQYMDLEDSGIEYGDGFLRVCTNAEYKGFADI
jgi:hypothetical protein